MNSRPARRANAHLVAVVIAIAAVCAPVAASAMTVLQADLDQLVQTSELVLHGNIVAVRTVDLRKEGRAIFTEYVLQVREVWKGKDLRAGAQFTWRHLGGTGADGITFAIPGMPGFIQGEEVVVLLERTSDGHVVTGAPQGKFVVRVDSDGGRSVSRDLEHVNLVRRDPKTGHLLPVGDHAHGGKRVIAPRQVQGKPMLLRKPAGRRQALAELRAEVRAIVVRQAAKSKAAGAKRNPR